MKNTTNNNNTNNTIKNFSQFELEVKAKAQVKGGYVIIEEIAAG